MTTNSGFVLVICQLTYMSHKIYIFIVLDLEHITTEIVNTIELILAKAYSGSSSWAVLINYFTALRRVTPRSVRMMAPSVLMVNVLSEGLNINLTMVG